MGERGVLRLAARQNGVVSRAQVLAEGVTARQIDRRREKRLWVSVLPGVYRIEGAPLTWLQQVNAAALWAGETGVVCHRTAAALWGMPRFAERGPIHVRHPTYRPAPDGLVTHQTGLGPRDVVLHEGFRVTTLPRTLLDLAATEAPADVRAAVDFVLARKRLSLDEFRALVIRSKGRRGVRLLRSMLRAFEGGDGPTESELEARVMDLIDAEGLPRPRRQTSLRVAGRWRRLDFFFPGTNVVIEADGFAWHSNPISFEKDRERANALAARGLVVLHWTWEALNERGGTLVSELHRALGRADSALPERQPETPSVRPVAAKPRCRHRSDYAVELERVTRRLVDRFGASTTPGTAAVVELVFVAQRLE